MWFPLAFQLGILGVRTVSDSLAAISSQARAMGPCPVFPSLLQPSKGPGSVSCAQGASGAGHVEAQATEDCDQPPKAQ